MDMDESNKKARLAGENDIPIDQQICSSSSSIEASLVPPFENRFATIRQWIAKPIDDSRDEDGVFRDPFPALVKVRVTKQSTYAAIETEISNQSSTTTSSTPPEILEDTGVLIGNKYHASDVDNLVKLGVTAVLNCASGGISRLPVNELREKGIRYGFTNVRQDDLRYPILHELLDKKKVDDVHPTTPTLDASQHLKVAKTMYIDEVLIKKGKLLFFCVAGQNRSATLALATLLLRGKAHYTMDLMCESLAKIRPFALENEGFQKQLLELEWYLQQRKRKKKNYVCKINPQNGGEEVPKQKQMFTMYAHGDPARDDLSPSAVASLSYDIADHNHYSDGDIDIGRASRSSSQSLSSAASNSSHETTGGITDTRKHVEIELLIPGLCSMETLVLVPSTIREVKQHLIDHVNTHLLRGEQREVAKSWVVLATFGKDAEYDLPLEDEAIEPSVQWDRISKMFGLTIEENKDDSTTRLVHWNSSCRFALVIFSVYCNPSDSSRHHNQNEKDQPPPPPRAQEPWTFVHRERPGAPSTLLSNTLTSTRLRAWDFCDGQAFESKEPIVFSFANDPRDKRQFMKISTCSQEAQQFLAPGEGGILGMGANAIVHRVELKSTSPKSFDKENSNDNNDGSDKFQNEAGDEEWDAAVKRPFSLSKMLASLEAGSEAGLGKRLRQLAHRSLLNSDGRVLYFYGLGVALSSNAYQPTEYKFEAAILARYEEEFSTYTMKRFMQDYISPASLPPARGNGKLEQSKDDWREDFSLISVKVLLVSLLNAFRDLTLMGVQAFDFNHLGNVLVSRDFQSVKLLDIDGDSRGSIPLSEYMNETSSHTSPISSPTSPTTLVRRPSQLVLHKPSLDVDLNAVLPTVVQQLLLGKRRGTSFVTNTKSTIWKLPPCEAKELIEQTVSENFGPLTHSHMAKVVEWFYAMLKKQPPWGNWTYDIYDAMRCIDHLPVR
jgi:protein-tyrosine phosphatase